MGARSRGEGGVIVDGCGHDPVWRSDQARLQADQAVPPTP